MARAGGLNGGGRHHPAWAGLYNASWSSVTRQYPPPDSRALFPGNSQECSIARPSALPKISSAGIADRLPQETNDADAQSASGALCTAIPAH